MKLFFVKLTLLFILEFVICLKSQCFDISSLWKFIKNGSSQDWIYDNKKKPQNATVEKEKNLSFSCLKKSFSSIIKQASPAVVEIYEFQVNGNRFVNPYVDDYSCDFFKYFKGLQRQIHHSSGSGVIISEDGIVATCAHVIQGSSKIKVRLSNGVEYMADTLLVDEKEDLALIKIKPEEIKIFPFLSIGELDQHDVGDMVLALGNAFGLGQTVTSGIISAPLRSINGRVVIQTDSSINPGNSGGELINLNGELIGVPNAIISRNGAFNGVGFCRPAIIIKNMLNIYLNKLKKGWLGIYIQKLTADMLKLIGRRDDPSLLKGVMITDIQPKSPARGYGITKGDIILKINNKLIITDNDFYYRQKLLEENQNISLTIWQKGKIKTIKIKAIQPPKGDSLERLHITGMNPLHGYVVSSSSPALAMELGIDERIGGIIIVETISKKSPIKVGDVIEFINDSQVKKIDDIRNSLSSKTSSWSIVLKRGTQKITLRSS